MKYIIERKDNSIAIMTVLPVKVILKEKAFHVERIVGKTIYLENENISVESPVDIDKLMENSIEDCLLVFPSAEDEIAKWPENLKNAVKNVYLASEIPSNKVYRDAWVYLNGGIEYDMNKARDIHRNMMRVARKPKLSELDVEYIKADEDNDIAKKAKIVNMKKYLRDITEDPLINSAQTIMDLEKIWPKELK